MMAYPCCPGQKPVVATGWRIRPPRGEPWGFAFVLRLAVCRPATSTSPLLPSRYPPAPLYRERGVAMKESLGRCPLLAGKELLRRLTTSHVLGGADHRRRDREDAAERNMRLAQLALHHHCAMQIQQVELLGVGVDLGLDRLGDERGLALHMQHRLLRVEQGAVEGDRAVVEVQPADGALDG